MKKFLLIVLLLSSIFVILKYLFHISFSADNLDEVIFVTFLIIFLIHLTFPFRRVRMKILVTVIPLFFIMSGIFLWEIFGYESTNYKTWHFNDYTIELEHRLEIAGPGTYWFVVNDKIGQNFMIKKRFERRANYEKMARNERFQFIVEKDTVTLTCCENIISLDH